MSESPLALPADAPILEVARAIERAGGRLVVVGGWVRDALRGSPSHDLDAEVFGLAPEQVDEVLAELGFGPRVGRQFPIWRRMRDGLDVAFPRAGSERTVGSGAGLESAALEAAFREAARHRDLRVDAIGWDPLSNGLLDPWDGVGDLRAGRLRAVDPATFGTDPVRLLRVARLRSKLGAEVDPELATLCRGLRFEGVPDERVAAELRRLLLDLARPSEAFAWLASLGRLDVLPPLARLEGVPQDPVWHPEGDVFVHTGMVVDRARELAAALDSEGGEVLLLAALCHDLGKPETTTQEGERIRSIAHEAASARRARQWLASLRFAKRIVDRVAVLVEEHLKPVQLVSQKAGARAYRRLARRLAVGGASMVELERLARADHLGRTTESAIAGRFEAGAAFLEAAAEAGVLAGPRPDVVRAEHWIERGVEPGPRLGRLLRRCREIEDETGWGEPERVLERCLARDPDTDP